MQLWFLNDRLRHPRRWLSATLLAGLLVMATAGAFFMYLADEIGEQAWLTQLEPFELGAGEFRIGRI
jgi:hypothetical protein